MAEYFVGEQIQIDWQEFSNYVVDTTLIDFVRLYYKIGANAEVFVENLDNSYATSVDANADGNNRHTYNLTVTSGMAGNNICIIVKDGSIGNIWAVVSGPHIITTSSASMSISSSPSSSASTSVSSSPSSSVSESSSSSFSNSISSLTSNSSSAEPPTFSDFKISADELSMLKALYKVSDIQLLITTLSKLIRHFSEEGNFYNEP